MEDFKKAGMSQTLLNVLTWGGLWGIFEATVGYLLHLLPFSIGWLVWYPAACFFMLNVYRKTKRKEAVILVGLLSACIKLLGLFLPGRIDRVLNPAVSIVFEALTMAAAIFVVRRLLEKRKITPLIKALAVLCMNTGWRVLYVLYLLFLVPDWIREGSVISSTEAFVTFFLVHNLFTSLVLFICSMAINHILRPIKAVEDKWSVYLSARPKRAAYGAKIAFALCLLGGSIALGMLL